MADYSGFFITASYSEPIRGRIPYGESLRLKSSPVVMSSTTVWAGIKARELARGNVQSVWVGMDAGSRTIKVKVKAPVIGKALMVILSPEGEEVLGKTKNTTTDWETLTLNYVATKGVYIVQFINNTDYSVADGRTYWDDLTVE